MLTRTVGGVPLAIIVAVLVAAGAVLTVYKVTRRDRAAVFTPPVSTTSQVGQTTPIMSLSGTTAFIQAADLPPGFRPFGPDQRHVLNNAANEQEQLLLGFGTPPCGGAQAIAAVPTAATLIDSGMWLADDAGVSIGYQASAGSITLVYSSDVMAEQGYNALDRLLRCEASSGSVIQVGVVSQLTGLGDSAETLRTHPAPPAGAYETIRARYGDKDFIFAFEDGRAMTALSEPRIARTVMSRP